MAETLTNEELELQRAEEEERRARWQVERMTDLGLDLKTAQELYVAGVEWWTIKHLLDRECPLDVAVEIVR